MIEGALEIIVCLYAAIQHIFRKSDWTIYLLNQYGFKVILASLCSLLSVVSFVALLVLLLPLAVYKKTIGVFLKRKHKENYAGFLDGIDAMWALETTECRHIINCLLFVNFDQQPETFIPLIKKIYEETIVYQFVSVRRRFLGYYYRLKNQVGMDDLIKTLELSEDERRNKVSFETALAKHSNAPMPKNDTACFELFVGVEPVLFRNNGRGEKSYPLLIRIHHSVGDGISLLSFLLKNLADEKINVEHEILKKAQLVGSCAKDIAEGDFDDKTLRDLANRVGKSAKVVCEKMGTIAGANVYYFAPTTPADSNILRGQNLSGHKVLAHYIEDSPGYISKIKSIKKRIPGSTFTDVLMTAVSASFWEYFKQKSEIPEKINLSFIVRPTTKNLNYFVSETGEKELKLGNKFSVGVLGLPIKINAGDATLQERLMKVKEESDKLKNSVDILVNYWQLRIFTNLLPAPVLNVLLDMNQKSTVSFSNLPGIRDVHIRGQKVQDVIFWAPNLRNIGVGLSILTYNERFQIGLGADKKLLTTGEEAHEILNNIIKYIDLLDVELNRKPNDKS